MQKYVPLMVALLVAAFISLALFLGFTHPFLMIFLNWLF
jgi:hypothetical protein